MRKLISRYFLLFLLLPFNHSIQAGEDLLSDSSSVKQNHFHYNQLALFTGASTLFEKNKTYFTLGVDYIRYFSPESNFFAGAYAEAIFAHHTEWLFGALMYYGITDHLWVRTGPGIEILQKERECGCGTKSVTEFLIRVGAGYSIHFGSLIIDPSIDFDFLRSSTSLVYGLNIGFGF